MKNFILALVACAAMLAVTESAEAQYYRGGRSSSSFNRGFSGSSFSRSYRGYSPSYSRSYYRPSYNYNRSYYRPTYSRYGGSTYRGRSYSRSPSRYRSYRY